ncbi:MAG: hypothetical protein R3F21_09030 [Myxococcota bacterium]
MILTEVLEPGTTISGSGVVRGDISGSTDRTALDGRILLTEKMRGLSIVSADGASATSTGTPKVYADSSCAGPLMRAWAGCTRSRSIRITRTTADLFALRRIAARAATEASRRLADRS